MSSARATFNISHTIALKELRKIDPAHLGLWVLIIPHVSYPKLMQIESYGIKVIQTTFQILPAETEDEAAEQRRITTHWLAILREKFQPILIEYFDANVCYDINEKDNGGSLTFFTKLKFFQAINFSSSKSSKSKVSNHQSSLYSAGFFIHSLLFLFQFIENFKSCEHGVS